LHSRYFLLPLILIISIGFSSNAFAADDSILSLESNFDSSFNYNLNDGLPLTLDQFTINPTGATPTIPTSDSISFPDISSTNPSNDLTYPAETSSSNSIVSETGLDDRDETNSLLVLLLFGVPLAALAFRNYDEKSMSTKYLKLSSAIVVLGMVSLFTAQAVSVGNSYWGYAFAELEPEVILPAAIESLQFDHSDKDNISFEGGAAILEQKNPAMHFDGTDDYLVLDSDLPSKLKSFTVSAWV